MATSRQFESPHRPRLGIDRRIGASLPFCDNCGTDEFLLYEDFTPARTLPGGRIAAPPTVSYTCTQCGGFSGHDVPANWAPPRWFWYS